MRHQGPSSSGKRWGLFGLLLIAFLLALGSDFALAQVTASLSGRIEDASGAAVPAATVTITSQETGATRTVTADQAGIYRVLSLPVGLYDVRAEHTGFKAAVQTGITLVVGQQAVVNVRLEVGEVQQTVTVTAEAAVVNTTTSSVSGLVGEKEVKDLPLNGRSFDNLITLNPGTVNFTSKTTSASSGSGAGNLFSVAGRRPEDNLFLLNGIEYIGASEQQITPGGPSGQLLGIDAIREFNVVTDAYSAEFGKRPGAHVSIVTQSGTNQIRGTVFEFLRNSALDARNFFDYTHGQRIPPFQRNQFGGAAGGPVRKDKTFIFGNYEGFRQRLGISSVTSVPDENARNGLLPNAQGVPTPVPGLNPAMLAYMAFWQKPNGPNLGSGVALAYSSPKQSIREDFGTTRLDHNFSVKDSLSGVYTIDDGYNVTPGPNPLFGGVTDLRSQVLSAQEQHILSPETINTFRVGFTRAALIFSFPGLVPFPDSLSFVEGQIPGQLTIGGGVGVAVLSAGVRNTSNARVVRNQFTYSDDIQLIKGKHQISLGAWFQQLQNNMIAGSAQYAGRATFTSLQTFLQGNARLLTALPDPTFVGYRERMGAWYVQDNIILRPNLTLRLGLRHEFTSGWNEAHGRLSNYIADSSGVMLTDPLVGKVLTENNTKWMFGPRAGLAWDPFGNGKTSIRAGFGTHYQFLDNFTYVVDNAPPYGGIVTFETNAPFPSLVPLHPGAAVPPPCGPGVPQPCTTYAPWGVQSNMKAPTVEEWDFTVEQQITPSTAMRTSYVGSHGYHQVLRVDPNQIPAQICSSPSGCTSGGVGSDRGTVPQGAQYIPVGARPNPYLSSGTYWLSEGLSSYNALQLDVTQRTSHGLQLRGNYTWASNMDTSSSQASIVNQPANLLNNYDQLRDYGASAGGIRHQSSISGSYELPVGHGKPWMSGVNGAADKLTSGWQVNWIVSLTSGFPYTPVIGANISGNGNAGNPADRPSINPAFSGPVTLGSPDRWYDPNAFILPVPGTYGNLGRGTLSGPGLGELDLSLFKSTALTERVSLKFRAEFFNILNRANFGTPNTTAFSNGAVSPSAGRIDGTVTSSRQIQFGMKLLF